MFTKPRGYIVRCFTPHGSSLPRFKTATVPENGTRVSYNGEQYEVLYSVMEVKPENMGIDIPVDVVLTTVAGS